METIMISAAIWVLLALSVVGLAVYRKSISRGEMDVVHIKDAEAGLIPQQESFARRLASIDRWGKLLTVAVVVYGLAIAAMYLLRIWEEGNRLAR